LPNKIQKVGKSAVKVRIRQGFMTRDCPSQESEAQEDGSKPQAG